MGTTQARMTDDGSRLYSVNRDVAHNFEFVVRTVADRLEDGDWGFLKEMCEQHGVTQDDLGEAARSFCLFVASATDHRGESMVAAMRRTGYYQVKEPAQVAYMAVLGTVMAGIYWTGVHEATLGGVGPCQKMQDLIAYGELSSKRMLVPRWKRWLYKLLGRLDAIRAAIRGTKHGEREIVQAGVEQSQHRQPVQKRPTGGNRRAAGSGDPPSQQGDGQALQERVEPQGGGDPAGGSDQGQQG